MKRKAFLLAAALTLILPFHAAAQLRDEVRPVEQEDTLRLTLEQALQIALSENVAVKVADREIERAEYARKGTYASLFPQVNGSAAFQRTIKKQVMYMDFDMSSMGFGGGEGAASGEGEESSAPAAAAARGGSSGGGIEVGRWNTWNAGVSATMPLVNAQLWKSLAISGEQVELAVEQARSSRLDMVTQVKQAFYAVLLAKEALRVYEEVWENAVKSFEQTRRRYNAQKASELEFTRAQATVANAIPNLYNAENSVALSLWQLKAVMGVDLDAAIDVAGSLEDFAEGLSYDEALADEVDLSGNSSLRQLAIQAEQLAETVKLQKYAYLPSLAANYSYSINAMTNDFKFSEYRWTPYSYVGISLNIPIFSGGKRLNDVRVAKVQQAELNYQRVDTERRLRIAIRQYLTTMETSLRSLAAAREAAATARKAYDISAKSYDVGRSTITDLNDASLALTQAELSVSQAVYNFVVAKSQLEQTLGYDFLDENGAVDLQNR